MTRIAFIGLGTMGLPMARNLLAAGHEVVAVDPDAERVALLGTPAAATPAEAAAQSDVALLSLPSAAVVEDVVLGEEGVRAGAAPGYAVVDMSTGPPALARRLAAELDAAGLVCLDAPVSGGPKGAEGASLTIMAGGTEAAFAALRDLLADLGCLVVHVGPAGSGQAAKLCNNLVAGVTMTAIAEACALASRVGLDPGILYSLMTQSTGDSRVLRTRFPLAGVQPEHPASNGYAPLFALDLMAKDLGLALEVAADAGVEVPVAEVSLERYREAQGQGLGGLDYSAVFTTRDR